MPDFVESALKDIDGRLRELQEEVSKLEAARSALSGTRRRPGRPRGSGRTQTRRASRGATASTRGRRGRRGRRGGDTRANQALALVRDQPGVTIPQIAKAMGIEPNYLYRVMPKLVSDGQVKREGQGWVAIVQQ